MNIHPIAEWGDHSTPFQITNRQPILHQPAANSIRDELRDYARPHLGFYGWLRTVHQHIRKITGPCLTDLPHRPWRDDYDGRVQPTEDADLAIDEAAQLGTDPS